jgi:hypothetical protein
MMSPAWPKRILFGHADWTCGNGRKKGHLRRRNPGKFLATDATAASFLRDLRYAEDSQRLLELGNTERQVRDGRRLGSRIHLYTPRPLWEDHLQPPLGNLFAME